MHVPGQKLRLGGDALGAGPTYLLYLAYRSRGELRRIDLAPDCAGATFGHTIARQIHARRHDNILIWRSSWRGIEAAWRAAVGSCVACGCRGGSPGGWAVLASLLGQAGCRGIEGTEESTEQIQTKCIHEGLPTATWWGRGAAGGQSSGGTRSLVRSCRRDRRVAIPLLLESSMRIWIRHRLSS